MKGSTLRPQAPKDGKQQPYGAEQLKTGIGRMPLVRVTLHDTVNLNDPKKAVAVGYLKVKIVESADDKNKENDKITMPALTDEYTIACNQRNKMTYAWSHIEDSVLQHLNISKSEFATYYHLCTVDNNPTSEAKQYKLNDKTNKYEEVKANDVFGKVTLDNLTGGETTSILSWEIDNNSAYEYFTSRQKPNAAEVTIALERGENSGIYLYITLKWVPENIYITPAGSLAGKNSGTHWFEKWSSANGADEIHFNVETPADDHNCNFVGNLSTVWNSSSHSIPSVSFTSNGSKYSTFDNVKYSLVINDDVKNQTGASGTKYVLSVQDDKLMAALASAPKGATQEIAHLTDPSNPENTHVIFNNSEWAKDLLNKAGHTELKQGETFTAAIKVSISDDCGREVNLSDNTFNVRFIRPISVEQKENEGLLKDGLDNGDTIYMKNLLSLIDWRHNPPTLSTVFTTANDYFNYYEITSIQVGKWDNDKWDFASADVADNNNQHIQKYAKVVGSNQTVEQYNHDIVLNYKIESSSPSLDDMGYIVYRNNGTAVSANYKIEVPFVIKYKWGYLPVTVQLTIQKTRI